MSTELQTDTSTEKEYYLQKISRLFNEINDIKTVRKQKKFFVLSVELRLIMLQRKEDENFRNEYYKVTGDKIEAPEETAARLSKFIDQKKGCRECTYCLLYPS